MDIDSDVEITTNNENAGRSVSKPIGNEKTNDDLERDIDHAVTIEEFIQKSTTILLDYEKHMFLDLIDTDGLVVCAKYDIDNNML